MWYAEQLATGKSLSDSFDPSAFRRHIFQQLCGHCMQRAHYDDDACDICNDTVTDDQYLRCDQCEQWFHGMVTNCEKWSENVYTENNNE